MPRDNPITIGAPRAPFAWKGFTATERGRGIEIDIILGVTSRGVRQGGLGCPVSTA
jgi:hypothetical protein